MQDSKTPMYSAIFAVLVNIILNLILIWFMGTAGLALSTAICSYLQVIILTKGLKKRLGHSVLEGVMTTFFKTALATAIMYAVGATVMAIVTRLPGDKAHNVICLAAVVSSCVITYIIAAKLLKMQELSLFSGRSENRQTTA